MANSLLIRRWTTTDLLVLTAKSLGQSAERDGQDNLFATIPDQTNATP